jgi:beta-1,4-mannosyltransferase
MRRVLRKALVTEIDPPRAISIMVFPRRGDSYVNCFYPPIEALGVKVFEGDFSGRWLLKNLRGVDYIQIHWPSFFYNVPERRKCLRGFSLFLFFLALARWRGARLIWTIHNLYPHDRCVVPQLDTLTRQLLVKMGSCFFVHGPSAKAEVLREFPALEGRIVLIDHGHWVGYYPNEVSCSTARSRLGLPDTAFVFLFIGLCKPYKNLEGLISAFGKLPGNPILVIAGKFQDAAYEAVIRHAVSGLGDRIVLKSGFVRHEDMQVYLRACNILVTPYREVLSSGSAILGLSFGRPVIAPAIGALKDLITKSSGILYDPSQSDGLLDAMRSAMDMKFDEAQIRTEVLQHDWGETAKIVVNSLAGTRDHQKTRVDLES